MSGAIKDGAGPDRVEREEAIGEMAGAPVSAPSAEAPDTAAAVPDPDARPPLPGELTEAAAPESEPRQVRKSAPYLRVVQDADSVDTETLRVGPHLRMVREGKNLSLEDVTRTTRITGPHLRAIEEMTPSAFEAPVYAIGHIKSYARYLGLNPEEILARYKAESGFLADPVKQEIAPPKVARSSPAGWMIGGVAGLLIIGAAGFGVIVAQRADEPEDAPAAAAAERPQTAAAAEVEVETGAAITGPKVDRPPLRLVALERAWVEVNAADGTKYRSRYFEVGESYAPRVGAGWTVTARDGKAFEWRLGESSLGLLRPEGGPVYTESVDLVLEREAVLSEPAAVNASERAAPGQAPAAQPSPAARQPRPAARTQARGEGQAAAVGDAPAQAAAPAAPAAPVTIGPADIAPESEPAPGAPF